MHRDAVMEWVDGGGGTSSTEGCTGRPSRVSVLMQRVAICCHA